MSAIAHQPEPQRPEPQRPERSEKRQARDELTEVAPNVLRSELPVNLPGLGHVNCYLLLDDDGVAIVDPGLPGDDAFRALEHRLDLAGLKVTDVHSIVVTHSHFDHYGAADRVRELAGAKIVAHPSLHNRLGANQLEDDAEFLDVDGVAPPEGRNSGYGHLTPWGTWSEPPQEVIEHWESLGIGNAMFEAPTPDLGLIEGATVMLAGRPWTTIYTPGHTADHLCLYDPEEQLMITGDHVLPTITPHISGYSDASDPLAQFFDSLRLMQDYDGVRLALPAHGDPFADLSGRAGHICDHHLERLDEIRDTGTEIGRASVDNYMQRIFKERSWGAMAASETYAHLDHLLEIGDFDSEWVGDLLHFRPAGDNS